MSDSYSDLDRAMAMQATYGRPNMPDQYSRPPVYSPFQNRHHIDDSFSYLANMYGPMLVQGLAGEDAFLGHQSPGQSRADQHEAAKYQRAVVNATHAATERGHESVARKLVGFESFVNGGLQPTQLDREHAQIGATVFNNPMFKGFAAANMPGGQEALEGLMFGRGGDPAAIASATGRIGFYRPDAMGGKRMSADGMEMFSTQLHSQLYGENANLDEMRGFGAHATGEMMQELFQHGRLPRSIGSLSPANRVKALSASKRDDKTMQALAEDYAHHELMQHDYDYASATAEERKTMLGGKVDGYRKKLDTVFQEADKFRANDPRAKNAADIEQLGGFSMAANAVDASRTGKVLKDYNGAIKAIRELFGDNGKSNAPVQDLINGLNALTGGAQMSMSPGKMEGTIRQIRLAARDAGLSDDQLFRQASIMQRQGMMLGLQPENVLRGMASNINYAEAMSEQGVFSKPGWGKLNKAEATEARAGLSQRADASHAGRALATLNRLASENKGQFAGKELEVAAEAYRQGKDTYTYDGKTVNLKQIAGMEGVQGLMAIAQRSGADMRQIDAAFNDRVGTNEYLKEGYTYGAQKYQLQQRIAQQNRQFITAQTSTPAFDAKFKPAGMSEETFRQQTNTIATGFSNALSDIVINETADMPVEERAAHMEKRGKEMLTAHFKSAAGGKLSQKQAEKKAGEYFNAFYGDTADKRNASMNTAYAEMNAISVARTGMPLSAQQQIRDRDVEQKAAADDVMNAKRAERIRAMSLGTETTLAQRLGEELDRLSSGDSGTMKEAAARVMNIFSEDEMLQKYAPDAQDALVYAGKLHADSTITDTKINKLAEAAAANPAGPEQKKLMALAGYAPGATLTDAEQSSLVQRARMQSGGTAEGGTPAERAANEAKQKRSNILIRAFNTGDTDDVRAGAVALGQEMLGSRARNDDIQAFATAALSENPVDLDRQISRMPKQQQAAARSVARFLRVSQEMGGLEGAALEQSADSIALAAERPTAKAHEFKRKISGDLQKELIKRIDTADYKKLRSARFGSDKEMGRVKGAEVVDKLSKSLIDITFDEMGGFENATPEQRAEYIEKRAIAELTTHFVENEKKPPEEAEKLAKEHFYALYSKDKKKRGERLSGVYDAVQKEVKAQGLDPESVAQRRAADVAAERATDAAADARVTSPDGKPAYDYKKLGVTDKVTADQQKLIEQIKLNPTGAYLGALMEDEKTQNLLLTLPDAAAIDLFKQFTPEQQAAGLAKLRQGADLNQAQRMIARLPAIAGGANVDLSLQDTQNLDRLHTAITKSMPGSSGVSSNNVVTPAEYAQAQAATRETAQGGPTYLPNAVAPNTEAETLQEQLATLDARAAAPKKGFGDQQAQIRDDMRRKTITQRLNELNSGNPLGFVQKEMAEIEGRKKPGAMWGKQFASWNDHGRYSELKTREKEILESGGVEQAGQRDAGVHAAANQPKPVQGAANQHPPRSEAMKVSGTLTLNGLREAILAASGDRMEDTPDGGAPVALGAPTGK